MREILVAIEEVDAEIGDIILSYFLTVKVTKKSIILGIYWENLQQDKSTNCRNLSYIPQQGSEELLTGENLPASH